MRGLPGFPGSPGPRGRSPSLRGAALDTLCDDSPNELAYPGRFDRQQTQNACGKGEDQRVAKCHPPRLVNASGRVATKPAEPEAYGGSEIGCKFAHGPPPRVFADAATAIK